MVAFWDALDRIGANLKAMWWSRGGFDGLFQSKFCGQAKIVELFVLDLLIFSHSDILNLIMKIINKKLSVQIRPARLRFLKFGRFRRWNFPYFLMYQIALL